MATTPEVARSIGVSPRGLRLRIDALGGVLEPYVRRTQNNALEFDGSAVALLRQLEDVRQAESLTVRQAAARVRAEVDGNGAKPVRHGPANGGSNGGGEVQALRTLVEHLERDRDAWKDHAAQLQKRIDELMPLALPRPRRWWAWWRR